jgi:hypothetical protein
VLCAGSTAAGKERSDEVVKSMMKLGRPIAMPLPAPTQTGFGARDRVVKVIFTFGANVVIRSRKRGHKIISCESGLNSVVDFDRSQAKLQKFDS